MFPEDQGAIPAPEQPRALAGRPRLGRPRRVRITTTIEPMKLILLRDYAQRVKKSLGQLADEYVAQRFPLSGCGDQDAHAPDSCGEQARSD
jgi:hypothetical protein